MNGTAACIADYPLAHFSRKTRMRKVWSEDGDTPAVGELGTVLGSVRRPDVGVAYFISWDKHPRGCVGLVTNPFSARFRNLKVTAPNGRVLFEGLQATLGKPKNARK